MPKYNTHRVQITWCCTFMFGHLLEDGDAIMAFHYDPMTGPVIDGPISHAAARLENLLMSEALAPMAGDSSQSETPYAGLVKPVAEGLFALAVAGGASCVIDVTEKQSLLYEVTSVHCGDRAKFFMPNAFPLSVVGPRMALGNTWGPSGEFKLAAIILEVGSNRYGPLAELTLVLPTWITSVDSKKIHEFALVKFDTHGYAREVTVQARVEAVGFTATIEPDEGLKYLLGIEPPAGLLHSFSSGSGIGSCLGFPFAEEILMSKMPLLKDYLVACAIDLGEQNS